MVTNKGLNKASIQKKDEFYTQLSDIEKEMKYYKDQFEGLIVFCNCDDPEYSNFWKYFYLNFKQLKIKRLIATHFDYEKPTYKLEYDGENIIQTDLTQNGDFRSPECIDILKSCDIVVTNPPFSLFREFVAQLMEYEKRFLIIGNQNALTYKEIFPLIMHDKMWYGASIHSHGRDFKVPEDYPLKAYEYRTDEDGNKYINVKGVRWFTNLDYKERHEEMILYKKYSPEDYPKYDNYDAIEVGKTAEIPCDYFDPMGVPISFMDKYNPLQFEILGNSGELSNPVIIDGKKKSGRFYLNNKRMYDRLVIRRKQ